MLIFTCARPDGHCNAYTPLQPEGEIVAARRSECDAHKIWHEI